MPRVNVNYAESKYRRFNDWLRGEMKRRKINQDDLATYLNCDRRTLGCRLNGSIKWSFYDVLEVVHYFDTDFDEIL